MSLFKFSKSYSKTKKALKIVLSKLPHLITSCFYQKKDFIEQYLNKLSYLPGDVITNSEPLLGSGVPGGIGSQPGGHSGAPFITTSYTSPFLTGAATTTAAPGGISTSGINDLLAETTMYNSLSSGKKSFFSVCHSIFDRFF